MAKVDQQRLYDECLERFRVRRVPLGDNLVFLFEPSESTLKGKLTCTLLLEGDSVDEDLKSRWMDLARHIYLRCPSDHIIRAFQISASVLNGQTSPVQRLIFDTEHQVPISIGCDDPQLMMEVYFPFEVLRALSDDMGATERIAPVDIAF